LAVTTAVALFVFYFTTAKASGRETKRVTRDIGFNLRIIPKGTDMDRFWAQGFSELTMPESAVDRLAASENVFFTYNHLVASLQRRWSLRGREVILTGVAPAITAPAQKKRPMGFSITPGSIHVGFQVAERLQLKKDDRLEIGPITFTVAQCLAEAGNEDDIRLYTALSDAQRLLELEGQINEIKAIDCLCLTSDQDPLAQLRAHLAKALPEAKVVQLRSIADARARQRQMVSAQYVLVASVLLCVCTIWIAVLAILNARQRRPEIGVLRALGFGGGLIARLFLGRALALGLLGALLGYACGSALALEYGPEVFRVTAKSIRLEPIVLAYSLIGAPFFASLASLVPTLLAITQDPADTLREG
jgi:ABC-type lipoprotein release transport system permease subunit